MKLKKLFIVIFFSLVAFASLLKGMVAQPSEKTKKESVLNRKSTFKDDKLTTIKLKNANNQTVFSINLPGQAIELSTTLVSNMSFYKNKDKKVIIIPVDQISNIRLNELKTALRLLKILALEQFNDSYIHRILTKQALLKLFNAVDYLGCSKLRTAIIETLDSKIKQLIFEKNKFLKALKLIQRIEDPDLYEKLCDLAEKCFISENNIKDKCPIIKVIDEHKYAVNWVSTSHNGKYFASASSDKTIRVWNIKTKKCIHMLKNPEIVAIVYFSEDDSKLFSVDSQKTTEWDLKSGKMICATKSPYKGTQDSVSPDCTKYASIAWAINDTINLFDTTTNTRKELKGHTKEVFFSTFSDDNTKLASSDKDNKIKIWDTFTGTCIQTINQPGEFLAFSPNSKELAIVGQDNITIWDIVANKQVQELEMCPNSYALVCFSADGMLLAVASPSNVKIWDLKTGKCLQTFTNQLRFVQSLCFTPNGNELILGLVNRTIEICSLNPIKEKFTLSTLWFLDYALSKKTTKQLPSEDLYFDLYAQLPEACQEMIIDAFDKDALNNYLGKMKN